MCKCTNNGLTTQAFYPITCHFYFFIYIQKYILFMSYSLSFVLNNDFTFKCATQSLTWLYWRKEETLPWPKISWHGDTVFGAVGSQPMFLLSLQQGQTWLDCNWAKLINNLSKDNHNHLDNGPSLFLLLQVCRWTDAASYLHHSIFKFIKLKIKHK